MKYMNFDCVYENGLFYSFQMVKRVIIYPEWIRVEAEYSTHVLNRKYMQSYHMGGKDDR